MIRNGKYTYYTFKNEDEPLKLLTEKFYRNRLKEDLTIDVEK